MADDESKGLNCGDISEAEFAKDGGQSAEFALKLSPDTSGLSINTSYPASAGNFTSMSSRTIKYIVIHYVGSNGKALTVSKYFQTPGRNASAHYVVGLKSENGQIYRMIDDVNKAWHCGTSGTYYHAECRNTNSIGIETACHNDTSDLSASSLGWYFDEVTVDNLVKLTKYLMKKYRIDSNHVLRHYDVTHKVCPAMWVHNAVAWANFKAKLDVDDVGILVASVVKKIGLASPAYWEDVLKGETQANTSYIKAVFEKVCTKAGVAYTSSTLIEKAAAILGLSSPAYWQSVINGTVPPAAYMIALFSKIDAAFR